MISQGEFLRLQTSDPEHPQYIIDPVTGQQVLNPERAQTIKGGSMAVTDSGEIMSQEGIQARLTNEQDYNKQLQNTLATISPHFDGDKEMQSIFIQAPLLVGDLAKSAIGTLGTMRESLKMVPSTLLTKAADDTFSNKLSLMGTEKANAFLGTLQAYGFNRFTDAINFGNDKTADQVLDRITKETGRVFDEQERDVFRAWADFQQKQKIEILKGQALNNWQVAWQNDAGGGKWHNKTTSVFNGLTTLLDAESQVLAMVGMSLIPYVGVPLSMATMGAMTFYQKRAEAYEKGWNIDKANAYSLIQGTAQMLLEYLPSHGFVKGFYSAKRSLGNVLANYVLPEAIEEASQQLFEDTLDKVTGLNNQTATEIVKNAALAGFIGGLAAGVPGIALGGRNQDFQRVTALETQEQKVENLQAAATQIQGKTAEEQEIAQQKATVSKEQFEKDLKENTLDMMKKNYPGVKEDDLKKLIDIGFASLNNTDNRTSISGALYNMTSNLAAKLNATDSLSKANMAEFAGLFGDGEQYGKQREAVSNALKTMFDKKLSQGFIESLTEVEMSFRGFLMQNGYSEQVANDWCEKVLRPNLMELFLQSGVSPTEMMKSLMPQVINLSRARYNGQEIGFKDDLSFISSQAAEGISVRHAKSNAEMQLDSLVRIQSLSRVKEIDAASESLHTELFGAENEHGRDMNRVLVALKNDAQNLKAICNEAGIMQGLRDQEYIVAALLQHQGYSVEEIAMTFGDKTENITEKYNNAVQKLFPALNAEELQHVKNLFVEAQERGFNDVMYGSYSKKTGVITISTDAPSSTLLHELDHHIMWTALNTQYRLYSKMGISMNTPISRYMLQMRNTIHKERGMAPTIDEALDVFAHKTEEFYNKGRRGSSDSETNAIYDAIVDAEDNAIRNANYTYEDLEAATKKGATSNINTLMKASNRPSLNMLIASAEFSQDLTSLTAEQLSERIGNLLNNEKNIPIRMHDDLLNRYNKITKEKGSLSQLELLDLALDVSNSLNATAGFLYAEEQDNMLSASSETLGEMPLEDTDAIFSLAGTVQLKLDNMRNSANQKMFSKFWSEKEIALQNSSQTKAIDIGAAIDGAIESSRTLKRFIFSPYAYLKGNDLFLARRVREAHYQAQKRINTAQNKVRDFYKILQAGMKKHNVTNAMYHANYMHPYLNSTQAGYETARDFVEKYTGKEGLKSFDAMDKEFKRIAKDLKAAGALRTFVEHFAPRHISNFPQFLDHLRRTPQHPLYNLYAEMSKAGKSQADMADAINAVFYNKQDWEKNKVTGLNRRKVLAIRREDLMYYDDPFDAALKYIEDSERTVLTRQLFGFNQELREGDALKTLREEQLIDLRETAKDKVLEQMVLKKSNQLFEEIDSIDTVEGWLAFAKKKGFKSDLKQSSTLEELANEKNEYEEQVTQEEIQNLKDNPEVQVEADREVDEIIKEQKRIFENSDAQYGIVGRILLDRLNSGKLNTQQINDIVYALRSVNVRSHAGLPIAQWIRGLNSLTVIGASIAAPFTNLREMKLTAARWGYHNTLYGFRKAMQAVLGARMGKLSDWMEKIGLPPMNEFIRPQNEKQLSKAINFTYTWTGFSFFDQLAKLTNAFASERSIANSLRKGDTESAQYKKNMEFINRVFAVDKSFDADGHYQRRYDQLLEDLKAGRITDDVKFLMYNAVSDQQPINALEVPVAYNYTGALGQLCYQFQTVSMKQTEFIFSDIIATSKVDKNLALQKIAMLAIYAAVLGVPESWLEDLLKGRKPGNVLPETLYAIGDYVMISPYMMSQVGEKGLFKAFVSQYVPSFNLLSNVEQDTRQVVFGNKKLKNARTVMNIPLIGQLLYNWFGGGAAWSKRQGIYLGDLDEHLASFDAKEFFLGDWD